MKSLCVSLISGLVLATTALNSCTALADDLAWEQIESSPALTVYRAPAMGHKILALKAVTDLPAPIGKVVTVIRDTKRHHEWADRLVEVRILKEPTPFSRLEYNHTSLPWPIKDRDFVFVSTMEIQPQERRVIFMAKSVDVEHSSCKGCVRGTIIQSRFELTPSPDGKQTHAEVFLHVDPEGSVPKWLVNWVQKRIPRNTVKRLIEQLKKPDISEYPLPGFTAPQSN